MCFRAHFLLFNMLQAFAGQTVVRTTEMLFIEISVCYSNKLRLRSTDGVLWSARLAIRERKIPRGQLFDLTLHLPEVVGH